MVRVAFGLWFKDRIEIWDKWLIIVYGHHAKTTKGREQRAYLYKIIQVLTGKKFVWFRHLFYLNDLLREAGLIVKDGAKQETRSLDEMERALHAVCADVGVRCGKTIFEVMRGMTDSELERYSLKLLENHYSKLVQLAALQASPAGFAKEIEKQLDGVRRKLGELAPTPVIQPDEKPRDMSIKAIFKWA